MYILSRQEQIDIIKKVIYKWEDALSDGYKWYCGSNEQENVDQYIEEMAEEILDEFHKEETKI